MSDQPLSDADRIRNKRLAKLASQPRPQPSQSSASADGDTHEKDAPEATPTELSRPKINISKDSSTSNPFAQLGSKPAAAPRSITSDANPTTHLLPTARPVSRSRDRNSHKSPESFEDDTLRSVFRITLNPQQPKDVHGHQLHVLNGVRADLEEQKAQMRLTVDILGDCIQEAASDQSEGTPFEYLLGCWKRVARLWRNHRSGNNDDPQVRVIKEARRMCMSYCIFAITMPEMFGLEEHMGNPLPKHLLEVPESELGIDHEFMTEAVSRFEDDDSIRSALVEAMEQLSKDLARKSMNDDYKPYILVSERALATFQTRKAIFANFRVGFADLCTLSNPGLRHCRVAILRSRKYLSSEHRERDTSGTFLSDLTYARRGGS